MAEKEERILCIETYEKIAECGYGDFYNTMTRQEAIYRMAKALKENEGWGPKDLAEAALNALLRVEND